MYFRRKTSAGRAYLQIVESRREGDQVRQQVIATLGRLDELQASGQLERLVRSGARFAAKAMVLRIMPSPAWRGSICIISIGRWRGSARSCRRKSRTAARRSHRAA
jgi:hypothetical protein